MCMQATSPPCVGLGSKGDQDIIESEFQYEVAVVYAPLMDTNHIIEGEASHRKILVICCIGPVTSSATISSCAPAATVPAVLVSYHPHSYSTCSLLCMVHDSRYKVDRGWHMWEPAGHIR